MKRRMLRAIIFDFDGVIVDSESLHLRAFQHILHEEHIELDDAKYYSTYLGLDDKHCFKSVLMAHDRPTGPDKIQRMVERKAIYYATLQDAVPMLPGAVAFIKTASKRYLTAIGSGALRQEIEYALRRAGILSCFSAIVSAEDVTHSKPAPDCYRTVLARLNARTDTNPPVSASECVVIEDAGRGIMAAKAAGMSCAAVTTSYPADALSQADLVASGLATLSLSQVESLTLARHGAT